MKKISKNTVSNLTQIRLKELLSYDPQTGLWTWLVHRSYKARIGTEAGTVKNIGTCRRRYIKIDQKDYLATRLAWLYQTGNWPENDIDHKDRDSLNDRWNNLRPATRSQNSANVKVKKKRKYDLPRGVCQARSGNTFTAACRLNGKNYTICGFKTPEEAHAAYVEMANKLHGEYAFIKG